MSNRNYKAMGPAKLKAVYEDLLKQPPEDRDRIVALAQERGLVEVVPTRTGELIRPTEPQVVTVSQSPAPSMLKPMLAFPLDRPVVIPTGPDWVMEPKFDGIRYLVYRQADGVVRCYGGRNGSDHTGNEPLIERALTKIPPDTILDGELVDGTGRDGVRGAASELKRFVVFDLIMLGGSDARFQPFAERRAVLDEMENQGMFERPHVVLTPQFEPEQRIYDRAVEAGWEGMVVKRKDGLYRSGKRSRDMLKAKNDETVEAVITGYELGKGQSNRNRIGALKFRFLDNGVESTAGYDCEVGEVLALMGKCVEIAHMGTFEKTGKRRHPRIVRFRPDRDPVTL